MCITLLSFLLEDKDEDLAVINDRLGIGQAMSQDDLEAKNLQKDIEKLRKAELELEKEIKKGTNEIVLNQAAQGPSEDASKKTESAPLYGLNSPHNSMSNPGVVLNHCRHPYGGSLEVDWDHFSSLGFIVT